MRDDEDEPKQECELLSRPHRCRRSNEGRDAKSQTARAAMRKAMNEVLKLNPDELTTEGDLRTLLASLTQHLHSATVKHADDTLVELDFATDAMGSRGRLRFRSYRRSTTPA